MNEVAKVTVTLTEIPLESGGINLEVGLENHLDSEKSEALAKVLFGFLYRVLPKSIAEQVEQTEQTGEH